MYDYGDWGNMFIMIHQPDFLRLCESAEALGSEFKRFLLQAIPILKACHFLFVYLYLELPRLDSGGTR